MSVPPISGGPEWDTGETLAQRFGAHARDSEDLYGYATRVMADDWEVGGPTRLVCGGSDNAPRGAVIHLRLLAGVFRLVLTGRAPELVPYYPCLGGTAPASQAWPVMREVIAANIDEIHAALAIPPQTNEVGRSAALLAGLCDLVAASGVRRIRLLEVGPSAGLNLIVDHYAYRGDTWQFGLHRHERLEAALDIAISHPVRVDKAQASDWLPQALGLAEAETLTVVWHSITQMYWLPEEVAAVEAIMRTAGAAQLLGKSAWSSSSTAIRTELNLSFALDCGASTHIPRVSDCLAQRTITASRSDSQAARADCVRPAQRMTWHQLLALGISSNWCQVTPTDAK